jgi:large subunit ribosomal protein L6
MSRIGKSPVNIPSGVDVKLDGNTVTVKGPKGELTQVIDSCVTLAIEDNTITFSRESDAPSHRAKHGLYRALLQNMVVGVSEGYKKELEVIGVGYRANATGSANLNHTKEKVSVIRMSSLEEKLVNQPRNNKSYGFK